MWVFRLWTINNTSSFWDICSYCLSIDVVYGNITITKGKFFIWCHHVDCSMLTTFSAVDYMWVYMKVWLHKPCDYCEKHIISFSRLVFCWNLTWQNLEGLVELTNLTADTNGARVWCALIECPLFGDLVNRLWLGNGQLKVSAF